MADPLGRADQERSLVFAQQLHKCLDVRGLGGGWLVAEQEEEGETVLWHFQSDSSFPSTLRLLVIASLVMWCASYKKYCCDSSLLSSMTSSPQQSRAQPVEARNTS
jgi:hypothetical protein